MGAGEHVLTNYINLLSSPINQDSKDLCLNLLVKYVAVCIWPLHIVDDLHFHIYLEREATACCALVRVLSKTCILYI